VASDVTSAIEAAVQPLLKKAVDDIYGGLLDATQDYLKDNVAFNIASRIDVAEREATSDRQQMNAMRACYDAMILALHGLEGILATAESNASGNPEWQHVSRRINAARAALALAEGRPA
jgi:hypothetical protein